MRQSLSMPCAAPLGIMETIKFRALRVALLLWWQLLRILGFRLVVLLFGLWRVLILLISLNVGSGCLLLRLISLLIGLLVRLLIGLLVLLLRLLVLHRGNETQAQ